MNPSILSTKNISKRFHNNKEALQGVSLNLAAGEIFGLIWAEERRKDNFPEVSGWANPA